MKSRLKKLFLLAILLLIPNLTKAESSCSYSEQAEINNIVANVKATYEVTDIYGGKTLNIDYPDEFGNIPEIDYYIKGFNFSILNITDDIYVRVTNNYDKAELIFRNSDATDGVVTFQTKNTDQLITYTIEVYANKYSCVGEVFRKFTITTPIYNSFSELDVCSRYPEFYYCQEFISSDQVTFDTFFTNLEKYEESLKEKEETEQKKTILEKLKEFYQNNAATINIVGSVIVVVGVATTVILVKRRRSRVL